MADVLAYLFILLPLVPLIALMLLFFVLPFLFGSKSLTKAKQVYGRILTEQALAHGYEIVEVKPERSPLYLSALLAKGDDSVLLNFVIMERRVYTYYFPKLLGKEPLPDFIQLRANANALSPVSLIAVPKGKTEVINKISGYLMELESLELRALKDFIIVADDPSVASDFISRKIVRLLRALSKRVYWYLVDYAQPNVELRVEVFPSDAERTLKIVFDLLDESLARLKGLKKRSKRVRTLEQLKEVLRSGR